MSVYYVSNIVCKLIIANIVAAENFEIISDKFFTIKCRFLLKLKEEVL
jgi:hypothetical protein